MRMPVVQPQTESEGLRIRRGNSTRFSPSLRPKAGETSVPGRGEQARRKNSFLLSLLLHSGIRWIG